MKIANAQAALVTAGFTADQEPCGPTALRVSLGSVDLLLALGFNREDGGWEAVLEVPGDDLQTPLPDGPAADADSQDVVRYVQGISTALGSAEKVREGFLSARNALGHALDAWQTLQNLDGLHDLDGFLLDEGYPLGASLDEVVASVGAYVERLDRMLGC